MELCFEKISNFNRGTLYRLLADAYSFDSRWQSLYEENWKTFDSFFFDHLNIADRCGFITTCDHIPIGHISWDPRNQPDTVILGHNCISTAYKGYGYGKMQLQEALRRIRMYKNGHISWDPRNQPDTVILGHNCISTAYKGYGYGKMQLQEALRRIRMYKNLKKITVTTTSSQVAAFHNYEHVGFQLCGRRPNPDAPYFGDLLDYELLLKKITVTTTSSQVAAFHNYEHVGFQLCGRRPNPDAPYFGDLLDYELLLP